MNIRSSNFDYAQPGEQIEAEIEFDSPDEFMAFQRATHILRKFLNPENITEISIEEIQLLHKRFPNN